MVAPITQKINDIVAHHLAPALKAAGFRKAGQRFRKRFDQHTWVVEVQRDKYNVDETGAFTVNLGVYHPAWVAVTQETERGRRFLPDPTDEPGYDECLVKERLDFLAGRCNDWWQIDAQTTPDAVGSAVVAALMDKGMSWLATMSPLEVAVPAYSERYIGLRGAWSYKTTAMFGWVALGRLDQAALLYAAASGDGISDDEHERAFGPWARARGIPIADPAHSAQA